MDSYVVTGGGRGIGRAIVERLVSGGGAVVVVEFDGAALEWTRDCPAVTAVVGDAGDETVTAEAVRVAAEAGELRGWVNNAAVFRDAWLHDTPAREIVETIGRNLEPAVAGCAAAIRHFLAAGGGGSVVNISSHQGSRPVRGSLPYATAKSAIEGLTRALAVDYGAYGVRVNALALGSIVTERSDRYVASLSDPARQRFRREIARLQPAGRMGEASEVADAVAFLVSDQARFVNGTVIPIDGGRSVVGLDPEESGAGPGGARAGNQ